MMVFEFSFEYTLQVGEEESDCKMNLRVLSPRYMGYEGRGKFASWTTPGQSA